MPKTDLVFCVFRDLVKNLPEVEKLLLEIKLLTQLHQELSNFFFLRNFSYQQLLKNEEKNMSCVKFMKEIINDILSSGEYSLAGISNYTQIPEEILIDIASGINANPSFALSIKILELHASVRTELYSHVMRKIASEYLNFAA